MRKYFVIYDNRVGLWSIAFRDENDPPTHLFVDDEMGTFSAEDAADRVVNAFNELAARKLNSENWRRDA